jgi:phenylalanyl-tRNA synthetase beta chain
MLISLNWLSNYVDLSDKKVSEIEYALTMIGFEVEGVHATGLPDLPLVVVGEVLSRDQHPDADRLGVCSVNVGEAEPIQIVCGASNYKVGDRVPVALVGARLPGDFKIKASKLRGVKSFGMMCSPRELG